MCGCNSGIDLGFGQIPIALAVVFPDLNFGKLRFRQRQRHMFPGRNHIELAWKQHDEPAGITNAIGDASGVFASAPVEIGARWSDDRRSRILRNHQAAEG
jgi:hypothetical protein